jgi:hypothetical protein
VPRRILFDLGWIAALALALSSLGAGNADAPRGQLPMFNAKSDTLAENPQTWPVVFSRVLRVAPGAARQITLDWDGIKARQFYLRLDAVEPFDATLVRRHDGSRLFDGHMESHYETLVPWGKGEAANLSLSVHRAYRVEDQDQALYVTLSLARDENEVGLAIYSFYMNRFLWLYRRHELVAARRALDKALMEDPQDSLALSLRERLSRQMEKK